MRVFLVSVLSLVLLCGNAVFAQQAKVKRHTAPKAGTVVLKDVPDKYNAQVSGTEKPEPDASAEQKKLHEIKEQIKQKYPHKESSTKKKTATTVQAPTVAISFVADSFSGIPPDNYMAVSSGNKGVTVMNSTIGIHDCIAGSMLSRYNLAVFSAACGLPNTSAYDRYDPKVVYDPVADRFICVMLCEIVCMKPALNKPFR